MFELGTFIVSIVTFLIMFWIIKTYGFAPLARMLEQRRQLVEGQISEAEQNRLQAEKYLNEQHTLLEEARKQAKEIVDAARVRADEQAREIVAAAEAEAERLLESNRQLIERERAEAMSEVMATVSSLTVELSEKLLHRHADQAVHAEMVQEAEKMLGDLAC
ncbi:ATP synthase F0 subunit B [Sulfoacidibacillus thermotolerans]|uniref:ATP synthase subunit b n=1 Tax=Sulfoacidibacillus thermotolerans TaxID=1765684 RepID=A0A2U3D9L5_SULT2|nr:ATP synthase F0 subunit B [Sulfoacidibacillus thermotolerans]